MRSQAQVIEVISPHTEQAIAEDVAAGPADVDGAVSAARAAFDSGPWGRSEPSERVAAIQAEGTLWASGTTWRGRHALRISVSGWPTTEADSERAAAAISRSR